MWKGWGYHRSRILHPVPWPLSKIWPGSSLGPKSQPPEQVTWGGCSERPGDGVLIDPVSLGAEQTQRDLKKLLAHLSAQ